MARKLNLAKLQKNLSKLKGEKPKNETRKSVFWSPEIGKHEVYILPWSEEEEYPFQERWFYFALGGMKDENGRWVKAPLTLKQFGKEDPIQKRIDELWNSDDNADKELAKKLFSNQTVYLPIIVKGEEELGPRLWRFSGKAVYTRLTQLFMDYEKYGVLNDPENERWIEVEVVPVEGKKPPLNKKTLPPDPAFTNAPLSEDPEQIKTWLNSIPDLDEALKWQKKNAEELETMLQRWANSGASEEEEDKSEAKEHTPKKSTKKASKKKSKKETVASKEEALAKLNEFMDDDDDEDEE
jgi:hypothetical protein